MEFGLHLPNAGPFATRDDILGTARFAEDLGFHSVWCFDHLFTPVTLDSKYPYSADGSYVMTPQFPFFDPLAVMAAVAAVTARLVIGTRVLIATYRHPVPLAKELATIDAISGGRLMIGVGSGWMTEEFDAVGVPSNERFARLDETVALLRQAWSRETSEFKGTFYSHADAGFGPRPPKGTIPIIVGGHGDAALRRAARWGDGWAVTASGAELAADGLGAVKRRLEVLRRYCDEEGRNFDSLTLIGQASLRATPDDIAAQAELGIHIVDLMSFGSMDAVRQEAETFMAEVAPQFA